MRSTSLSRSTPSSGSSEGAPSLITSLVTESPGVFAETVLLAPLARFRQDHFAVGSLRRLPTPAHAADSYTLAAARRPTGFTSPGSSRVEDLPVIFRPDRPWAPDLQRFLPAVAARSSRIVLSPLPFHTLRCRGSEDSSYRRHHALRRACHLPCGCVLRRRRYSRRQRVAPLLVVSPLRG